MQRAAFDFASSPLMFRKRSFSDASLKPMAKTNPPLQAARRSVRAMRLG
jgi:hypothetical protein